MTRLKEKVPNMEKMVFFENVGYMGLVVATILIPICIKSIFTLKCHWFSKGGQLCLEGR